MATPINWSVNGGEGLEKVMAVFLAQDFPKIQRRTPSSGDGGVDLFIPQDDGFRVHQVKNFTGRFDANRRTQVEESWKTFRKNPKLSKPILEYNLSVPIDMTDGEQEWFEELVEDAPFPVHYLGEPFWNKQAADHPHVVDYYFGGGKDRVVERASSLASLIANPGESLNAIDVATSLERLRNQLSKDDPHYRYEFATSKHEPDPSAGLEDCVFVEVHQLEDGGYLTLRVFPKHLYSTTDRPITGRFQIKIPDKVQAKSFEKSFKDFQFYGRAFEIPEGTLTGGIFAPGGLGGEVEGGSGRIGPVLVDKPTKGFRLRITSDSGETIEEIALETEQLSVGELGGAEWIGHDKSKYLSVSLVLEPEAVQNRKLTFHFTLADCSGVRVTDVVHAVRIASLLKPPNKLELLPEFGPTVLSSHAINKDLGLVPQIISEHLNDLAFLQELTDIPILVPHEIDREFVYHVQPYVKMLKGEIVEGSWDKIDLELKQDATPSDVQRDFADGGRFALEEQRVIHIDENEIPLGSFTTVLQDVKVEDGVKEDATVVRLVPRSNNRMKMQKGTIQSLSNNSQN